jgi:hypothetical protein
MERRSQAQATGQAARCCVILGQRDVSISSGPAPSGLCAPSESTRFQARARRGWPAKRPEHMPRDRDAAGRPLARCRLDIGQHGKRHRLARLRSGRGRAEDRGGRRAAGSRRACDRPRARSSPRPSLRAKCALASSSVTRCPPLIEIGAGRERLRLHLVNEVVVERRHVAVFLRDSALEPGLARMDRDPPHPGRAECLSRKSGSMRFGSWSSTPIRHFTVTSPAGRCRDHRRARNRPPVPGRSIRTAPNASRLHPVRRAADIEVDLVIPPIQPDPRRLGQLCPDPIRQAAGPRGVRRRRNRQHAAHDPRGSARGPSPFPCIEQRPPRHQPMQIAAMTVGPVHHRGTG